MLQRPSVTGKSHSESSIYLDSCRDPHDAAARSRSTARRPQPALGDTDIAIRPSLHSWTANRLVFPGFGGSALLGSLVMDREVGRWHGWSIRRSSRREVVELVKGRRGVAGVAAGLGAGEQSIYTWRRQARIDAGGEPGLTSAERAEMAAARRRIRELETEVAIHRRAAGLLEDELSPRGGSGQSG